MRLNALLSWVVALSACHSDSLALSPSDPTFGPMGETIPITVTGTDDLEGATVTLSALPSTIVISPANATLDEHGNASAVALVPYGVSGDIVASSALASTGALAVTAAPLMICKASFVPTMQVTGVGQVYRARVRAVQAGDCDVGIAAPPGVLLSMAVMQGAAAATVSMVATDSNGDASVDVLVPWGGSVLLVASGAGGSATASVSASPLTLCPPTFAPTSQVTAMGRVYSARIPVVRDGDCVTGVAAPSGVALSVSVSQGGATLMTAALETDATGAASMDLFVPWGTSVLVVASGAGGSAAASVIGESNPTVIACMRWTQTAGVYDIEADVQENGGAFPAVPVTFSVASAAGTVGGIAPAMVVTDSLGHATAVLGVPDPASLPVVVEAASGSSSMAITLDAGPSGAACQ
ncbi:MAG TPA: hypothetical protein VGM88_04555 [Kofleriaceae bacterium]|jgi:hypothetical protein